MSATLCTDIQLAEPRVPFDGLHLLFAAAKELEKRSLVASPYLNTDREKRKLEAYVRRFQEITGPQKHKKTRLSSEQAASLVGRTISKLFKDERGRRRAFKGTVLSQSCTTKDCPYDFGAGVTATVKYFVQYEDGDSEDMIHSDLVKYLVD